MKCLSLNQPCTIETSEKVALPKFNRSESISCAADCVKMVCNEKYGRHYIATRDIKAGEVVFCEESHYIHLRLTQIYLVCSHCLAFAWAGIPCDSCVFSMYCSNKCKNEAWSLYHDIQCPILSHLNCEELQKFNLIVIANFVRIFIIIIRREGLKQIIEEAEEIDNHDGIGIEKLLFNNRLDCQKFRSIYNLMKTKKIFPRDDQDDYIAMVLSLSETFLKNQCETNQYEIDDETLYTSMTTILKKLDDINVFNTFVYQSSICTCTDFYSCDVNCPSKIGSILAPCSSLINHSCDQHLSRMCLPGPKIVLFTLRPVTKGEQICTSYGPDPKVPRKDRRETLQNNLEFVCDCKACHENWPTPPPLPSMERLMRLWSGAPKELNQACALILDTPMEKWSYSEKLMGDAANMLDFIYKHLDDREAFTVAEVFRAYIDRAFFGLYGENIDLPNTC
ncbi:hypothetical protein QAD02_015496 [Eretmocerus hayati]|uniref:Uncharacterized protein n=1 Tax=Eretmocerus hayati TaxID=131215 RepID=A0ACC2P8V8_9HYME|nr:hypothetical protein QAD02_015496 [Eretmocerus hayati]